ncbi:small ribosomal subunit protein uS5m-like isoform X2 [Liolophura sinensis]|uniref:small ribosomal subunit protein uS5m-like isoform X2 n=1 Tax=Liolophura sinensis TaxID=3198878 RepID=UPI00315893BF
MASACASVCRRSIFCTKLIHTAKTGTGGLSWRLGQDVLIPRRWFLPCVAGTNIQQKREASFFTSLTADDLWKGVSGVSNAGKKRGRGKRVGRKRKTDLNRGQFIGEGRSNMVWPGLNAPVIKGKEVIQIKKQPPNPEFDTEIQKIRDKMNVFRVMKVPPLQRGWTGARFPGMSMGPPDPVDDYVFEGFDSRILEFKMVTNMTGNLGRRMRFSVFIVVGNKNGLAGYALAKASNAKVAIRKAKNMAGQKLSYIQRYDGHTVYHNFYTKEDKTAIFVNKREKGYGLRCHRALKTICEVVGITDMYAKAEGSKSNIQNLTKAFFKGLRNQETHQELADRLKLHVIESSPSRNNMPVVVASPSDGQTRDQVLPEEDLNFDRLYYDGKVQYIKPEKPKFYERLPSWKWKLKELTRRRNQPDAQIERLALGLEKSGVIESKKVFEEP